MVKMKSTFSLLFRMMMRTVKNGFAQFLAIIAIGSIAVTLFTGLISNAMVFSTQVEEVYSKGNLSSLWVTTKKYDQKDEENLSSFLEQGEKMEGRYYLPVEGDTHSFYLCVSQKLPTISKPFDYTDEIGDDFVLLDKAIEEESLNKIHVGDETTFFLDIASYKTKELNSFLPLLDRLCKDGKENIFRKDKIEIKAKVTGFVSHPENINKAAYQSSVVLMSDSVYKKAITSLFYDNFKENYVDAIYSYVAPLLGLNSLEDETIASPNQYVFQLNEKRDISALKKMIEDYYKEKEENNLYYVTTREQMPFYMTIDNDVRQAVQFTFVFPMVFFLVAILVILTTLSQIVLKDRNQIGTLKAIGVEKKYIYGYYIFLTLSLVFLSLVIGETLGPLLIPNILGKKYQIIYTLPSRTYQFPLLYGLLTALIFLFVSGLVTFLVCHKEVMLKPSESMRPKAVSLSKRKTSSHMKKAHLFSFKMAYRNILMNKVKSMMVVIGVIGCTALLVCGFGIEDTVNYGISHDTEYFRSEDITLSFSSSKTKEDIEKDLFAIEGIEYIEESMSLTSTLTATDGSQENTTLRIVKDNALFCKVDVRSDEIAVSEKVAKKLNLSLGMELQFTYHNEPYKGTIGAIYPAFFYNGILLKENFPLLDSSSFLYKSCGVNIKEGYDVSSISKKILSLDYVSDCKTKEDWQKRINNTLSGVLVMTMAVKVFAILLGLVVVYNLTLMNYRERSRDIATLKVMGFTKGEILRSLILESLSLTLVGVLFGLALGYPFMLAVMMTNKVELVDYLFHIDVLSYILSFLLTFGVTFVINLLLSFKIKKIKMIESLKSVE